MSFTTKLVALAVPPILAGAALLFGRWTALELPVELSSPVRSAHTWLLGLSAAYLASTFVAWRYSGHFGWSAGRMLLWGLIAFLCLSNGVELFEDHRGALGGILGEPQAGQEELVVALRARLAVWASLLVMSIVSIALGFEGNGSDEHSV